MKEMQSDSALMHQQQQQQRSQHQQQQLENLPFFFEVNQDGSEIMPAPQTSTPPQKYIISLNVTEVGTDPAIQNGQCLLLPQSPYIFPRHCVLAHTEGIVTITPSHREAETFVNNQRIFETTILQHGCVVRFGSERTFRFVDPIILHRERLRQQHLQQTLPPQQDHQGELNSNSNYVYYGPQRQSNNNGQNPSGGKDNILPAVLEFREETEEAFFNTITISLDVNPVQFKLAPTYTTYMATRFRASTHYRPELVPEERAIRLTEMLNNVSERIYATVQMNQHDASKLAFWMANSSELLHFLKSDRHITSFSLQAQDILAETVHLAFKQLVLCLQTDLKSCMPQILMDQDDEDISGIMHVLASSMNLLRKCRVNAALTIQLFSQLFHFINMWTFNQIVMSGYPRQGELPRNYCTHRWGLRLKKRLAKIESWAEKQGLELAADCHLARVVQAAHLLLARKNTAEDIASVSSICFKLNSLQLKTLLHHYEPDPNESPISNDMIETIVRVAENTVDEMTNSEGREVRLEEDFVLQLPFLLPEDGYSCDIVRGVPGGLVEFIAPLQQVGLCVMTPQPTSSGYWTIYMDRLDMTPMMSSPVPRSPSEMSQVTMNGSEMIMPPPPVPHQHPEHQQRHPPPPHRQQPPPPQQQQQQPQHLNEPEIQYIQLAKSTNGMGLSIVAAKGVGKDKLGIYIKAVVPGGAAFHDGRLLAGDQLLKVDGQSLVGITQERAAEIMMKTGPRVELEVAKQGAIYHGLATLLSQPSPLMSRSGSSAGGGHPPQPPTLDRTHNPTAGPPFSGGPHAHPPPLPHSKSVPALYGDQQHTYQNQTVLTSATSSQSMHGFRGPPQQQHPHLNQQQQQQQQQRPTSAYSKSASVQNLLPSGRVFSNGQPMDNNHRMSLEEQSFYQNVGGPMAHTPVVGDEHDLFHASPRVAGTPMGPSSGGPEKPQRQYSYAGGIISEQNMHQHQQQMRKEVHFRDEGSESGAGNPNASGSNGGANRVRFQEPAETSNQESEPDEVRIPPFCCTNIFICMNYFQTHDFSVYKGHFALAILLRELFCLFIAL